MCCVCSVLDLGCMRCTRGDFSGGLPLIREAVAVLETAYLDTLKQVKEGVTARQLARHQMAQCIKGGMIMSWCSPLDIASRWFPQQPEELHLYMSEEDWPVKRNDEIEIFWDMGGERQGCLRHLPRQCNQPACLIYLMI